MIVSELLLSVEFLAAVATLLFMAKLVWEGPILNRRFESGIRLANLSQNLSQTFGYSSRSVFSGTSTGVVKRSLLNQHVARRL